MRMRPCSGPKRSALSGREQPFIEKSDTMKVNTMKVKSERGEAKAEDEPAAHTYRQPCGVAG
jgi:hypothetical protein